MSDVKYYKNGSETIQNVLRVFGCGSDPIQYDTDTNRTVAYTIAARHRNKPRRLLPTPLSYLQSAGHVPFDEYVCKAWPCGTSWRSGSYTYTHNADLIRFQKRFPLNRSKKSTYTLLANSGFTSNLADYGESLASLSETGKMIHRRARQISEIANALRRRNFGHLENVLKTDLPPKVLNSKKGKELSSGWLELEFGWKPLVQDVYSAVELYRGTIVNSGQLVKSARYGDKFEKRKSLDLLSEVMSGSDRVSARAYGIVSNPLAFTLNQLGLLNPALLAWQVLPFSFVVDWFLPISRILGHLTNRVGLSAYVICTVSESTRGDRWGCANVWKGVTKRVERQVSSSLISNVTEVSPRSLGLWHATAASALIAQSFGRRV